MPKVRILDFDFFVFFLFRVPVSDVYCVERGISVWKCAFMEYAVDDIHVWKSLVFERSSMQFWKIIQRMRGFGMMCSVTMLDVLQTVSNTVLHVQFRSNAM